jgi:aryl-alcohol dehydrogenase-like predicted oxidoreductase
MSIEPRTLGRTGIEVPVLGLGTNQLTAELYANSAAVLDAAAELGVGYVDTAPLYGAGAMERLLGSALASHPDWTPLVSTKVGYLDPTAGAAVYRDPAAIRDSVDRSRERLGLETIDILLVHEAEISAWWGLTVDGAGVVVDTLLELKAEGVIRAVGLGSNGWNDDATHRLSEILDGGLFDVALIAGGFTLVDQPIRREILPVAAEHGVGVVVGGTLASGTVPWLLNVDRPAVEEMLRTGEFEQPHSAYRVDRRICERVLNLYEIAAQLDISMTDLAVRYSLSEPGIHSTIPGAREVAHLRANYRAASEGAFDADTKSRIDAA